MREERELAEKFGYESPVCDTLENTHDSYNTCLTLAIKNSTPQSYIFVASHNKGSIDLAKSILAQNSISDYRVRFG